MFNDPVYIADGQTSLFRSETDNQYTVLITDEDLADIYTFTATGLPTWMSLDAATGVISGTPTRADDGVYNISITVEDAGGLSDTKDDRPQYSTSLLETVTATGLRQVVAVMRFIW